VVRHREAVLLGVGSEWGKDIQIATDEARHLIALPSSIFSVGE
jgi:hypothetical protein